MNLPLARILIVDDVPDNIDLLVGILGTQFEIMVAINGEIALALVESMSPDLILLDVMMPGLNGYDVCIKLKADQLTAHIPIIFVTSMNEVSDEQNGLWLGAADYITKPICAPILLARVQSQLGIKRVNDFLRDHNAFLEQEVERRVQEIAALQDVTIQAMASLAETRDNETGNHIRRTSAYVRVLAQQLKSHPRFCDFLSEKNISLLFKSAPLHDIGKIGIPDQILLKPGRLTPEEMEIMKTHTTLGKQAIESAQRDLGVPLEFLQFAKEIAYSHQEKWDGSGYPLGLSGDDIPISARLMAVADVYDALISRRPYKKPFTHQEALTLIREGRNQHFDPDIVDAFLKIETEFEKIAMQFSDT